MLVDVKCMARRPNSGGAPCQIEGIESSETEFNKAAVRRRHRRLVVLVDPSYRPMETEVSGLAHEAPDPF